MSACLSGPCIPGRRCVTRIPESGMRRSLRGADTAGTADRTCALLRPVRHPGEGRCPRQGSVGHKASNLRARTDTGLRDDEGSLAVLNTAALKSFWSRATGPASQTIIGSVSTYVRWPVIPSLPDPYPGSRASSFRLDSASFKLITVWSCEPSRRTETLRASASRIPTAMMTGTLASECSRTL